MNTFEIDGLKFFFYMSWHAPSDASSICFIPREDCLQCISKQKIPADKIAYDLFTYLDDFFYDYRQHFDFRPMFKETTEIFELHIDKKQISTQDLTGLIYEHLLAA